MDEDEDDEAEIGPRPLRQFEYEQATSEWFSSVVRECMAARDTLYASMPREEMHGTPTSIVPFEGDEPQLEMAPFRNTASGSVSVDGILEGDFEDLHLTVSDTADQLLEQTMKNYFVAIGQVAESVGNSLDGGGRPFFDVFAESLERMDISFDKDGRSKLSVMMHPDTAAKLVGHEPTTEQAARLTVIVEQKRKEWNASRRDRSLPRLSY